GSVLLEGQVVIPACSDSGYPSQAGRGGRGRERRPIPTPVNNRPIRFEREVMVAPRRDGHHPGQTTGDYGRPISTLVENRTPRHHGAIALQSKGVFVPHG